MTKLFKIELKNRKGETIHSADNIAQDATVLALKKQFLKDCPKLKKIDHNRLRLTVGEARGPALADKSKPLTEYIKTDSTVLYFKDLGPQVSWTTVFLVEYAGPFLITLALIFGQELIYGRTFEYQFNQKLGIFMVLLHYFKREMETIFVHRFSNDTMPYTNIFKNSTHYWILCGFCNMYFYLHPEYTTPAWQTEQMQMGMTAMFCFFEFMNLMCHIQLMSLRKPGSTERGIPKGWGFDFVSCANYFWEALCWITFSVQSQVGGAYLFTLVSALQMLQWALQKHRRYKKDFGDKYPRGRKAMFPFLI